VGALGMLHNILIAGWKRSPKAHGIPLEYLQGKTVGKKVSSGKPKAMQVLLEAEATAAGLGVALLPVFFSDIMLSTKERDTWTTHRKTFQDELDKKERERNAKNNLNQTMTVGQKP
jgi:hypothetical protein